MTGEPTTREVMIEVRAAIAQLNALTRQVESLTQTMATTYVPRGEYNAHREADDRRVGEVEKDVDNQSSFRRQVAAGALIGLLLLIADIISRVQGIGT